MSLASTMDHKLILSAIAAAVGLPENDVRSQRETPVEFLQQRDLLLLVDNVEQVIGSAPLAPQTLELVPGAQDIDDEPRAASEYAASGGSGSHAAGAARPG